MSNPFNGLQNTNNHLKQLSGDSYSAFKDLDNFYDNRKDALDFSAATVKSLQSQLDGPAPEQLMNHSKQDFLSGDKKFSELKNLNKAWKNYDMHRQGLMERLSMRDSVLKESINAKTGMLDFSRGVYDYDKKNEIQDWNFMQSKKRAAAEESESIAKQRVMEAQVRAMQAQGVNAGYGAAAGSKPINARYNAETGKIEHDQKQVLEGAQSLTDGVNNEQGKQRTIGEAFDRLDSLNKNKLASQSEKASMVGQLTGVINELDTQFQTAAAEGNLSANQKDTAFHVLNGVIQTLDNRDEVIETVKFFQGDRGNFDDYLDKIQEGSKIKIPSNIMEFLRSDEGYEYMTEFSAEGSMASLINQEFNDKSKGWLGIGDKRKTETWRNVQDAAQKVDLIAENVQASITSDVKEEMLNEVKFSDKDYDLLLTGVMNVNGMGNNEELVLKAVDYMKENKLTAIDVANAPDEISGIAPVINNISQQAREANVDYQITQKSSLSEAYALQINNMESAEEVKALFDSFGVPTSEKESQHIFNNVNKLLNDGAENKNGITTASRIPAYKILQGHQNAMGNISEMVQSGHVSPADADRMFASLPGNMDVSEYFNQRTMGDLDKDELLELMEEQDIQPDLIELVKSDQTLASIDGDKLEYVEAQIYDALNETGELNTNWLRSQRDFTKMHQSREAFITRNSLNMTSKATQKGREFFQDQGDRKPVTIGGVNYLMPESDYEAYMAANSSDFGDQSFDKGTKDLLNLIGGVEANGNYNAMFGAANQTQYDLSQMSIGDIYKLQDQMVAKNGKSSAIGKYQFIRKTLKSQVAAAGMSLDTKFTPEVQDKLALQLLEKRGYSAYKSGKLGKEDFMLNLSMEWASLPKDASGKSYYAGDGLNKSLISYGEVGSALDLIT